MGGTGGLSTRVPALLDKPAVAPKRRAVCRRWRDKCLPSKFARRVNERGNVAALTAAKRIWKCAAAATGFGYRCASVEPRTSLPGTW